MIVDVFLLDTSSMFLSMAIVGTKTQCYCTENAGYWQLETVTTLLEKMEVYS